MKTYSTRSWCIAVVLISSGALSLFAQEGWTLEGGLRRWRGTEITGSQFGCSPTTGNPIVESSSSLLDLDLVSGVPTSGAIPSDGSWQYVPRNPHMMIKVDRDSGNQPTTTISFYDAIEGGLAASVTLDADTRFLVPDPADTWIAEDASVGAVVFMPTSSTPTENIEYVFAIFDKSGIRLLKHIKPKVDVDIYVRPNPEEGVLVYVRGNGLQITGYTDEVFTNASYIYFNPDGLLKQLSLPERGPGSGKGRKVIWHSNKWDRLVFSDEYASGIMLVKASNGIPIDTVEHLAGVPDSPMRIISASGNNNDRWLVTHARSGDKNVLVLWAMPETREVTTYAFETSDPAVKQLPQSPWSVLIPFLSVSQSGNALYAWDAQDVLSVHEGDDVVEASVSPVPAHEFVHITVPGWDGVAEYRLVNTMGVEVRRSTCTVDADLLEVDVRDIESGRYSVVLTRPTLNHLANHTSSYAIVPVMVVH